MKKSNVKQSSANVLIAEMSLFDTFIKESPLELFFSTYGFEPLSKLALMYNEIEILNIQLEINKLLEKQDRDLYELDVEQYKIAERDFEYKMEALSLEVNSGSYKIWRDTKTCEQYKLAFEYE